MKSNYKKYREYYLNYAKKNPQGRSIIMKRFNAKRRQKIIEHLGGKCIKCGFSDWRALQVDHVNGDGYLESRKNRQSPTVKFYNVINDKINKYQLLCANCNWIKRYENNENRRVI